MCVHQSQSPNLSLPLPFPPWYIFKLCIRGTLVREIFQRCALSASLCFLISSPVIDWREWKRIRKQVWFMCACVLAHTHTHTYTPKKSLKRTNEEYSEEILWGYGKQILMMMKLNERGWNIHFHLCYVWRIRNKCLSLGIRELGPGH